MFNSIGGLKILERLFSIKSLGLLQKASAFHLVSPQQLVNSVFICSSNLVAVQAHFLPTAAHKDPCTCTEAL